MRAFLFMTDERDRAYAETVLRRVGCDDIVSNPDEIGNGLFHYAVLQVFDETVDHLRYDMDLDHPRMRQLTAFIASHPDCYVLAITHKPCVNDGSLATGIGADYWLTDGFLELLESHLEHARNFHRAIKGIPSWDAEAAPTTVSIPVAS
jgi:hypothetical protein